MMQHVGSNTRYTIVPVGTIIYASGLNNLETTLDNEMFAKIGRASCRERV